MQHVLPLSRVSNRQEECPQRDVAKSKSTSEVLVKSKELGKLSSGQGGKESAVEVMQATSPIPS